MNIDETNKLLDEAISEGKDYLPRLKEGLSKVTAMLQEGREGEGIGLFIESIEGLEWLATLLDSMACFRDEMVSENGQENINVRYRQTLKELVAAWENRDLVLISDLLEFEMGPLLEKVIESLSREREN